MDLCGKARRNMIQVRQPNGEVTKIEGRGLFVELVNDMDGTVMMVFSQLQPGILLKIDPGSPDADRYESIFKSRGVKFARSSIVR
jgi:hypothetical protein